MTISIRFNDEEAELIKQYAKHKKTTVSQVMRESILAELEDEYDIDAYQQAMQAYKEHPITHNHDEVKKLLDLE
ncbi:type II toxin-antitoxin system RelB family antitoxin [Entomospira culicis]|uniref:CopG family transcriptional regulator n=1 Tax=Entomospira culicis TaxID=2719989 RepID=A0A968KXC3_9SPIO|nr:DUF6290 family protein [Entomospira culicis]NIZ19991.1 CopG family transcriptional regulator [Entomospira culicis]NIZ70207.1 CopG family transcriptional regulator [Entomospira culicis]WDI38102.1 DUF6290 family protein [Entomospira culicis]WDI39724.1 DUF6290 family protein [Entomospira culicis]